MAEAVPKKRGLEPAVADAGRLPRRPGRRPDRLFDRSATPPGSNSLTTYVTQPIGQIFLRLLFMLVIPLLFSALVVGISEMGEIRSLKRVGLRTLAYTVVVSSIAVAVSLVAVNLLQARRRGRPRRRRPDARAIRPAAPARSSRPAPSSRRASTPSSTSSPTISIEVMGSNSAILSVMFFALFFGIGLLLTDTPNSRGRCSAASKACSTSPCG